MNYSNLKKYLLTWPGLVILILVIIIGIQTCRVAKATASLKVDKAAVAEAMKAKREADGLAKKALKAQAASDALAAQIKADANKAIAVERVKTAAEHKALIVVQAQIKTLTGDQLAANIGFRIGEFNISAIASGSFILTRSGAEKTYSLFLDGEQAARDLIAEKKVGEAKDSTISVQAQQIGVRDQTIQAKDVQIVDRDAVIKAIQKQVHDLQLARTWKFIEGTGLGILVGFLGGMVMGK